MKKTLVALLLVCSSLLVGAQTEQNPLSVAQALKQSGSSSTTSWVRGYVVGELSSYSNGKYFYQVAPPFKGDIAYLLADNPFEFDVTRCLVLQFPASALVDSLNLEEHPEYWQKELLVAGQLKSYNNLPGLKSVSQYRFLTPQPWVDESLLWTFFEDAEQGDYEPRSASSIFAGGTYSNDGMTWDLQGATYGNTSNDNKWASASFRLRLTEGATGQKGSLTLTSNKINGVGQLRFWAGNYKDDAALLAQLSIFYSTDDGRNWHPIVEQMNVKRGTAVTTNGMSEYAFSVNVPGYVRIKFEKADNTSAGINIDNIHLSDYQLPTSTPQIVEKTVWCYALDGGIRLLPQSKPYAVSIYSINGALLQQCWVNGEEQKVTLPVGIYLLHSDHGVEKVALY